MALDPELRALLEALDAKMDAGFAEAAARDAKTRAVAEAALQVAVQSFEEAAATRLALEAKIEEAREEARKGFEAASSQAGTLNDKALAAIKALGDGLTMHRAAVERHAEDRERALMNAHVLPLEAGAANHEKRIVPLENARADHENRIRDVEHR